MSPGAVSWLADFKPATPSRRPQTPVKAEAVPMQLEPTPVAAAAGAADPKPRARRALNPADAAVKQGQDGKLGKRGVMVEMGSPPNLQPSTLDAGEEMKLSAEALDMVGEPPVKGRVKKAAARGATAGVDEEQAAVSKGRGKGGKEGKEGKEVKEPADWRRVWRAVAQMRAPGGIASNAPVDTMGESLSRHPRLASRLPLALSRFASYLPRSLRSRPLPYPLGILVQAARSWRTLRRRPRTSASRPSLR